LCIKIGPKTDSGKLWRESFHCFLAFADDVILMLSALEVASANKVFEIWRLWPLPFHTSSFPLAMGPFGNLAAYGLEYAE
jgi:hypothetical protein